MKNPDDQFDDILRSGLKRKFDDFASPPPPSSFEKIRNRLNHDGRGQRRFGLFLLLAVFMTGASIYYSFNQNPVHPSPSRAYPKAIVSEMKGTESGEKKAAISIDNRFEQPIRPKILTYPNILSAQKLRKSPSADRIIQNVTKEHVRSPKASPGSQNSIAESDLDSGLVNREVFLTKTDILYKTSTDASIPHTVIVPILIPQSDLKFAAVALPSIVSPVLHPQAGEPYFRANGVRWLFNLEVLQSFQLLTIPSSAENSYQNFSFSNPLSTKSINYKFGLGAEWKGIQLLLHYSKLRNDYSYEIASNDYLVTPLDGEQYKVVRQGVIIHDQQDVNLFGLGVNKQFNWGHSPSGNYYATAGLAHSRELNINQSINWINAGIGRQFGNARSVQFNVGPYAEFSPQRRTRSGTALLYQPYRIGISLSMKLPNP